jgi:hypothetical protein
MSIFSFIAETLGISDPVEALPDALPSNSVQATTVAPTAIAATAAVAKPAVVEVDVVSKLEQLAADSDESLNWKVSIVDLLKLLKLDSSLAARKALAQELGCPAQKMADSAQMNRWLHKTILQKLAQNGGNIPAELLD